MNLTLRLKNLLHRARSAHPDLPERAEKVADAIVKAPHTLLRLPRRHTLTFWRAMIVIAALSVTYCGVEEAKLRWHCPRPLELTASELAASHDSPMWIRVKAVAPRAEVAVEASEGGTFKGVWLPLVSPDDPGTVVAMLRAPDRDVAGSLQTGQIVTVEGLAYFPRENEVKNLGVYLHWLDRPAVDNLRILDFGRSPASILGIAFYFAFGIAIFSASLVKYKLPRFGLEEADLEDFAEEPMLVVFDAYRNEPLPEEVKVDVHHMLDEAWEEVARR